jgi:Lon protease-like protein
MANYNDLPLFPLHLVLFPTMPLPLHIFEPRYREMIARCRREHSPFGIVLIQTGDEIGDSPVPFKIGTLARIVQAEDFSDGRINIVVTGESRFIIDSLREKHSYLTASVTPFKEDDIDPADLRSQHAAVAALIRQYVINLCAATNRHQGAIQLPQEPEYLSYAVASVLQIPLAEKQALLEMRSTKERLQREISLLQREISSQSSSELNPSQTKSSEKATIVPVNTKELSKLSSKN